MLIFKFQFKDFSFSKFLIYLFIFFFNNSRYILILSVGTSCENYISSKNFRKKEISTSSET